MSGRLFPLFARLDGRPVLVVGGGVVAERKVALLLESSARVTVGAVTFTANLDAWHATQRIAQHRGPFDEAWLDDAWLVIAATDDTRLNARVARAAQQRRRWVNVVDDAGLSSFHVPAIVDRSPLVVAISSGGAAPMLARRLRERLEIWLGPELATLARLLARLRPQVRARLQPLAARRRWFDQVFDGAVLRLLRRGQPELAHAEAERLLDDARTEPRGSVILVGAGAGDADLLTLRGLRALNQADVILHDRLVSPEVLALARRDAERIEVGKQAGHHHATQESIHALLLQHAKAGRCVVRLKGGDPFVFGRGGEELQFLRAHGIPFEVVPGITAALACAAYAGIPLTHRDHARSVRLVTAHCRDSVDTLNWRALAAERDTLAVYMGVAELEHFARQLRAHGRSGNTPFALVENGGRAAQRVVSGVLAELPALAKAHQVASPALLILGEVAALAHPLSWFGAPPLGAGRVTDHGPHVPTQRHTHFA